MFDHSQDLQISSSALLPLPGWKPCESFLASIHPMALLRILKGVTVDRSRSKLTCRCLMLEACLLFTRETAHSSDVSSRLATLKEHARHRRPKFCLIRQPVCAARWGCPCFIFWTGDHLVLVVVTKGRQEALIPFGLFTINCAQEWVLPQHSVIFSSWF